MIYSAKSLFSTLRNPKFCIVAIFSIALIGCTLGVTKIEKHTPLNFRENNNDLVMHRAWVAHLGSKAGDYLIPHVKNNVVTLASMSGMVVVIDSLTGRDIWRLNLGEPLIAGIGSDGNTVAVVSRKNELIVLQSGREQWRQRLTFQVHTSPIIAGDRVFILGADHTLMAFDAASGQRLWTQSRPGEPLVLQHPGVLLSVGNTLIAGISGRLLGVNPDNGIERWEVTLVNPQGSNDIDRLVELIGPVSRSEKNICVRAYRTAVGCVDVANEALKWIKKSDGLKGLEGDKEIIFGVQSNGNVNAWSRNDGSAVWFSEYLKNQKTTAPLLFENFLIIGDDSGLVHILSSTDGAPISSLVTDGTAIAAVPVKSLNTLIVVTRKGDIYGFRKINEK